MNKVGPKHVAIILDGNRRWARQQGLTAIEGHLAGAHALREVVRAAARSCIDVLTASVFSSEENSKRDAGEVQALMELITWLAQTEREGLAAENIRVRMIGREDRLPHPTRAALRDLIDGTAACTGLTLNLAIEYSARTELCDAARALADDVARGALKATNVNEKTLGAYLYTAGLPDPDLLIRSGGELRLSNFLLYQAAYSELWSTSQYWPAFDATTLEQAIADFAKRQRRFGT